MASSLSIKIFAYFLQEIIKLEQVCTAMYETGDANVREHAQKILVDLVDDVQVLQKCQLLFQRSAVS